jgi:hypothetical protein
MRPLDRIHILADFAKHLYNPRVSIERHHDGHAAFWHRQDTSFCDVVVIHFRWPILVNVFVLQKAW